jgi:hypothetical protein
MNNEEGENKEKQLKIAEILFTGFTVKEMCLVRK